MARVKSSSASRSANTTTRSPWIASVGTDPWKKKTAPIEGRLFTVLESPDFFKYHPSAFQTLFIQKSKPLYCQGSHWPSNQIRPSRFSMDMMSSSIAAFAMSQCQKRRRGRNAQALRGPAPADKRGRRPARGGGGRTHPSVGGTGGGGAHPRGPVGPGGKPQEAVHTAWKRRGRRSNESAGDEVKIIHPNQSDEPDQSSRPTAQASPRGKHAHDIPPPLGTHHRLTASPPNPAGTKTVVNIGHGASSAARSSTR